MGTSAIIISVLSVLVVVLGYTTFNTLFKLEKQEELIGDYRKFFQALNQKILESDKKLKEVDSREIFKSDDEIGSIFSEIINIHNSLANFFKVEQNGREKEKEG